MLQGSSKSDCAASPLGWLFFVALLAGLATELFTPLGLPGGVGILVGYFAVGDSSLSCFERPRHREWLRALWPAALAASLFVALLPAPHHRPTVKSGV